MKTRLFPLLFTIMVSVGTLFAEKVQIGDLYYNLNEADFSAAVTSSDNNYEGLSVANIPDTVSYIGILYDVTSIENQAFSYCSSLTSVTIPSSVTSIGGWAFENCSNLTTISVVAGNSVYDSRDNCNAIIITATNTLFAGCKNTVIPNSVTGIGDTAFGNCDGLTSITIPSSVTSIGGNAFTGCSNLTSITIPSSVTSIGGSAFSGCNNLTSITVEAANSVYDSRDNCNAIIATATNKLIAGCKKTVIPSSVTSIASAFQNYTSLTSVNIPNSVTNIESYAFYGCSGLTSITCKAESAPELGNNVFDIVNKSIPLYVPSGSIAAYKAADQWSEFTNIRAIGDNNGTTPTFPGDPGTLTYDLTLSAAEVNGGTIEGQDPEGAGGYPAGTEVTITAKDITGYEFVRWSDDVTDKTRTIVLNESMTLTALYSHSMIEIAIAANKWNFICLPPLGDRQYTEDMFTYDGLTGVKWGTYNGSKRAAGQSGWETPETFNALQGYIIYSTTAGSLRINAYVDDIRQGDSGNTIYVGLTTYGASHPENDSWNLVGNPYSQGYNIAGFAAAGIESPITVWNGTAYSTYTPGIDSYILNPFEAFFIQKAEGGTEGITFSSEYVEGSDSGNSNIPGTLSGYFSVSESTKIRFSKGNLQYQASTNTWRFAENQYDTIGALNTNTSASYSGWIDLFGWGTGNNPTLSSTDPNDYGTYVEWGTNAISNGGSKANQWRTLTMDEWNYLFNTRTNASSKYGQATVAGVHGIIILPDVYEGTAINTDHSEWNNNTISALDWAAYEADGAVFLPAAGSRWGTGGGGVGSGGDYWSSTPSGKDTAYYLDFGSSFLSLQLNDDRSSGFSVRLVR